MSQNKNLVRYATQLSQSQKLRLIFYNLWQESDGWQLTSLAKNRFSHDRVVSSEPGSCSQSKCICFFVPFWKHFKLVLVLPLFFYETCLRDGTGQDFSDPTGKFQIQCRLTGFWPARSTVFFFTEGFCSLLNASDKKFSKRRGHGWGVKICNSGREKNT